MCICRSVCGRGACLSPSEGTATLGWLHPKGRSFPWSRSRMSGLELRAKHTDCEWGGEVHLPRGWCGHLWGGVSSAAMVSNSRPWEWVSPFPWGPRGAFAHITSYNPIFTHLLFSFYCNYIPPPSPLVSWQLPCPLIHALPFARLFWNLHTTVIGMVLKDWWPCYHFRKNFHECWVLPRQILKSPTWN